jgi:hypothetical protein
MGWLRLRIRIRDACPQNVRVICSPPVRAKMHSRKPQAKPAPTAPPVLSPIKQPPTHGCASGLRHRRPTETTRSPLKGQRTLLIASWPSSMRPGGSLMIRSSGSCSGRREIHATRTPVGGAAPSAGRAMPCCVASANTAARSTSGHSLKFRHSPTGTPTGIAKRHCQTWTFTEQTKLRPMGHQSHAFPRDWRISKLAINRLTTHYALIPSWCCLRG